MPTYEYKCAACGHEWEEEQRIVDAPLDTCPACKEKTAHRQISAGNFILKGGGWYADLYSSPSKKGGNGGASKSSQPSHSSQPSKEPATPSSSASSPAANTADSSKTS
ncbi:MAG TPA: zinc ribbon domain-containing protein [Polyangiaceae bacterium]|nr:zinc ribbon domain-containing protein [Polyangiaceae bacterium]HNZ20901.1 zinc ribbon domain-containing protein [Polyangiaceae bacterium]HOD21474.1 zinc ribbon domain-containing protein [Polyangiaceae bacterium]HOE47582.1 zinc ribbon domain-containing protein [Polyangiaceae bacterium]HOG98771.1 zinc ribbon domain-containing protein [Polyangiaceae bacterium]